MDQRRGPTRRRFASRRGLEGELVERTGVGGTDDNSKMRSMTAPTPEQIEHQAEALYLRAFVMADREVVPWPQADSFTKRWYRQAVQR